MLGSKMQKLQTELANVIYNAATQAFEAKVTVHDQTETCSYACELKAPIDLSFKRAASGLIEQALRKHGAPSGLRSVLTRAPTLSIQSARQKLRRGLPLGQYGFFRGRAA